MFGFRLNTGVKSLRSVVMFGLDLSRMERRTRAMASIDIAKKILSSLATGGTDSSQKKQQEPHPPIPNSKVVSATRHQRSNTVRPKTAYFPGMDENEGPTSATISGHAMAVGMTGDHVISHPIPVSKVTKPKEKKKVNRSSTFRKEKKEDKKEEKDRLSGLTNVLHQPHSQPDEKFRVPEGQYVNCIKALKTSLEDMVVRIEVVDMFVIQSVYTYWGFSWMTNVCMCMHACVYPKV